MSKIVSIHIPREGGATAEYAKLLETNEFQSTLPAGGATQLRNVCFFNLSISIHAPRGGSDSAFIIGCNPALTFQSTLPAGGATIKSGKRLDKSVVTEYNVLMESFDGDTHKTVSALSKKYGWKYEVN